MAKAYSDDVNDLLRALAQSAIDLHFEGKQGRFAKKNGLSAPFVSEFLSGKRGAGLELLMTIARYYPVQLLQILGIEPSSLLVLWSGREDGDPVTELPNELKRATRAAIELFGCAPSVAMKAANAAYAKHGETPHADPDWWLGKMRGHIDEFRKSDERPSIRLLKSPKD